MKKHIASAIGLSVVCFGLSILLSGAPMRVHFVDALSLVLAFTIPASHITELQDIKNRWRQIIIYWFFGTLVWFLLLPLVVVKTDLNVERLATLTAVSFIGLLVFISLHLTILRITTEREGTK